VLFLREQEIVEVLLRLSAPPPWPIEFAELLFGQTKLRHDQHVCANLPWARGVRLFDAAKIRRPF
jgi:hypothetical protein